MKNIMYGGLIFIMSFVTAVSVFTQESQKKNPSGTKPTVVSTGLALYWKTLTPEEKNTFLMGYLTSHYDILTAVDDMYPKTDQTIELSQDIREIIHYLDISSYEKREEFITFIDIYYRRNIHKASQFEDALRYAYRMGKATQRDSVETQ